MRGLLAIIYGRVNIRGFVGSDFLHLNDRFLADMTGWLKDGRIKYQETVFEGFDQAPAGLSA